MQQTSVTGKSYGKEIIISLLQRFEEKYYKTYATLYCTTGTIYSDTETVQILKTDPRFRHWKEHGKHEAYDYM